MAEFVRKVRHFSLGLRDLGFGKGDKLIILSENRPEWTMTDFAAICQGGITVPVYTTLVAEQVKYIIDDSDATIVVVSDAEQGAKVEAIRPTLAKVKHFITFAPQAPAGVHDLRRGLRPGREARRGRSRTVRKDRPVGQARRRSPRSSTPRGRRAFPRVSS